MKVRCHTVPHPRLPHLRERDRWRVEVDRPQEQGGPFYQNFKGGGDAYYAAQMAAKWRRK